MGRKYCLLLVWEGNGKEMLSIISKGRKWEGNNVDFPFAWRAMEADFWEMGRNRDSMPKRCNKGRETPSSAMEELVSNTTADLKLLLLLIASW